MGLIVDKDLYDSGRTPCIFFANFCASQMKRNNEVGSTVVFIIINFLYRHY
jgi:hypothetical protein